MNNHDAPLPAYKDFCPDDLPTLDAQHAAEMFLGKTIPEAEAMFRENFIYYAEDLTDMGSVAFEYYLPAVWNYLVSEASRDDHTISAIVEGTFQSRHEMGTIGRAAPLVLQCMDYVIANFDKFDITEMPDINFKELASEIHQDEGVRELLKSEWTKSGGAAEDFPELWKMLENPPADINFKKNPPGLTTLERWKALRQAIAKN